MSKFTGELNTEMITKRHAIDVETLRIKANISKYTTGFTCWEGQLEKFAQLVAESATKPLLDYIETLGNEALAQPTDTSALEAMIAKAGEVMRERAADACLRIITMRWESDCPKEADDCNDAIRALPGVTLEDLQQ